ncbi:MAG: cobalt ECF transporter T component CbiQ [Chloroflexota bacterium]|nr:cobalt ECF transporter T component CbiQ [Chloroflexota bacterium]
MKHHFLDQYSDRDSLVHRLDPRTKFLATLLFILLVSSLPFGAWPAFMLCFGLIAALTLFARLPIGFVLKRSLVIVPFVLLISLFIPFLKGGTIAGSYSIGLWQVSITYSGLEIMTNILIKSWLSILSLIVLTSTTRLPNLLKGLERLRLPRVLTMILSFMYRYLFILADEVMRMQQARDSRSFGPRRWSAIRTTGNMIGTLFIRSYERGERVYQAMVARGFDGQSRTLDRLEFSRLDGYFGAGFGLVLALAAMTNLWY